MARYIIALDHSFSPQLIHHLAHKHFLRIPTDELIQAIDSHLPKHHHTFDLIQVDYRFHVHNVQVQLEDAHLIHYSNCLLTIVFTNLIPLSLPARPLPRSIDVCHRYSESDHRNHSLSNVILA